MGDIRDAQRAERAEQERRARAVPQAARTYAGPAAAILHAIADPGAILPRRTTCSNCHMALVDRDDQGWYYQVPVTSPGAPGLTFMDRVHECHGVLHVADPEPLAEWQTRAALEAAAPVIRADERQRIIEATSSPQERLGLFKLAAADGALRERERIAAEIGPDRLEKLADWFDTDDEFKTTMFPGTWPARGSEVQDDLRWWARVLRGEA